MTGQSDDARTSDEQRAATDSAWDALVDSAQAEADAKGKDDPPDASTTDASDDAKGDDTDALRAPVLSASTSGSHTAVGKDRVAHPDEEMERLMSGAPPRLSSAATATPEDDNAATSDDDKSTATSEDEAASDGDDDQSTATSDDEAANDDDDDDDNDKSTAASEDEAASDDDDDDKSTAASDDEAASDGDGDKSTATSDEEAPSDGDDDQSTATSNDDDVAKVEADSDKDAADSDAAQADSAATTLERPPLRIVQPGDTPPPRAARPVEPPAVSAPPPKSLPWGLIAIGAAVVGAVAFFATRPDEPPSPTAATAPASAPETPTEGPQKVVAPTATDSDGPSPTGDSSTSAQPADSSDDDGAQASPPVSDDPREPPAGTSPEAAAAFVRLPVSPSDGPPVGGIGVSGIHIDAISIGSRFEGGDCGGRTDDFSVDRREHVSVCLRVVHQREKEELQVLWQKHGGSTRRSKIVVQPKHAYRTRGYLKLRSEYIGDWTVRILSSDDVELARHDFTVTP